MKLVIDIPEEIYLNVKKDYLYDTEVIVNAFKNGIPLPKGHGRLKDVDWIDDNCEVHHSDTDGSWCYTWKDIDNAPTIIEADKEE